MRVLSFVVFIIGCILCFSDASVGWGIALMVLGVIMNFLHHFLKAAEGYSNRRK